jgi:hypothetical protein
VNVLSGLPADQRGPIEEAAAQVLEAAGALPLIVDDDFADNDYLWPQASNTYQNGIKCTWELADNAYRTTVETVGGGAWCSDGLSKVAKDFLLNVDLTLRDDSNSEIGIRFRVADDQRFYELTYSTQTQQMWLSYSDGTTTTQVFAPTYVASIERAGTNTISLLALGPGMSIYVNGTLEIMVSGEQRLLDAGRIMLKVQLNEANADEQLAVTKYELRGE